MLPKIESSREAAIKDLKVWAKTVNDSLVNKDFATLAAFKTAGSKNKIPAGTVVEIQDGKGFYVFTGQPTVKATIDGVTGILPYVKF